VQRHANFVQVYKEKHEAELTRLKELHQQSLDLAQRQWSQGYISGQQDVEFKIDKLQQEQLLLAQKLGLQQPYQPGGKEVPQPSAQPYGQQPGKQPQDQQSPKQGGQPSGDQDEQQMQGQQQAAQQMQQQQLAAQQMRPPYGQPPHWQQPYGQPQPWQQPYQQPGYWQLPGHPPQFWPQPYVQQQQQLQSHGHTQSPQTTEAQLLFEQQCILRQQMAQGAAETAMAKVLYKN
jgi:hypothetical protein